MVEVRIGKSLKVIGEFKLIREDGTAVSYTHLTLPTPPYV